MYPIFRERKAVVLRMPKGEKVRTVQADKDRTDIRNIVAKAMRSGGVVGGINFRQGVYQDISDTPSYPEMLTVVARAQSLFEKLPAKLRERFSNDPQKLMEFVSDPANADEAIKLGILKAPAPDPEPPAPLKVEVVNTLPSSDK